MENKTKFLYGAAVQGIQSFIFKTNELKDIAGASELVEKICTEYFSEYEAGGQLVVQAAGNIKFIFDDENDCRKAVLEFPRKVMTAAPGITISQAVVKMDEKTNFTDAVELLEHRLRTQRNRPVTSITTGLIGVERSKKTGLPAVEIAGDELIDLSTMQKRANFHSTVYQLMKKALGIDQPKAKSIAFQLERMVEANNWIAIIHADGNGLGNIISKIGKRVDLLKSFSNELDLATTKASQKAYQTIILSSKHPQDLDVIPFRPVVLGGDDLTMICRADLAIDYTRFFLTYFQEETEAMISNLRHIEPDIESPFLTACAGIAFVKASYPFYYGYQLAEALCERAKKDAKRQASCLMFHKVQSSFVEDYEEIVKKELTPCEGHSFEFGPYYVKDKPGRWSIDNLCENVSKLTGKKGNAIKSDIREWMTMMNESPAKANQKSQRVEAISEENERKLFKEATTPEQRDGELRYPAYDMLVIQTIQSQITK